MNWARDKIWGWPEGLAWKISSVFIMRSIRKKYGFFISSMQPKPDDRILDVGVGSHIFLGTNFLEQWYKYPEKIVALAYGEADEYSNFSQDFPKTKLIFGDGKAIPFPDNYFDIVFCNAVVEHAGKAEEQKRLIRETIRVGKKAFITTPNFWFPIDTHTLLPFVHYLPLRLRFWVYKIFGKEYFADINRLNLLTEKELLSFFPEEAKVTLIKQRFLGLVSGFIVIANKQ